MYHIHGQFDKTAAVYDPDSFRNQLEEDDIQAVIPESHRGNKPQKEYDKQLNKVRHIIENTFLHWSRRTFLTYSLGTRTQRQAHGQSMFYVCRMLL